MQNSEAAEQNEKMDYSLMWSGVIFGQYNWTLSSPVDSLCTL
jgi:hypothetical protein